MAATYERALELIAEEIAMRGKAIKHAGIGAHRVCEVELLQTVAIDIKPHTYIELGCGAGYTLDAIKEVLPDTLVVGYEHFSTPSVKEGIIIKDFDIFSVDFLKDVVQYTNGSPLFIYCDNGNKKLELDIMSRFMKSGDVLGTHDYPNEVFTDVFLLERGFVLMTEHEPYIEEYSSLQRFWRLP